MDLEVRLTLKGWLNRSGDSLGRNTFGHTKMVEVTFARSLRGAFVASELGHQIVSVGGLAKVSVGLRAKNRWSCKAFPNLL